MKTYAGDRTIDGIVVTVDGEPLDQRLDLKTITDDGFEWSFEGPASAQLALAILADHTGDDAKALRLHEPFMREIVANFANEWQLTSDDVEDAVTALGG
ncbi:MAG: DUF6166 domain-containing protein [Hyphomicrobiaceae bacterium]